MRYTKITAMFDEFFFKLNDVTFREPDVKIFLLNTCYHHKRIKYLFRSDIEPDQVRFDNFLVCST